MNGLGAPTYPEPMAKKNWLIAAIGAGVGVAVVSLRRKVARWGTNPDPLKGQDVEFPAGLQRVVTLPDGARLSTVTAGEGPPIVCVHGLTGSHHDWGPMAPKLLAAGYQLITVEQRGHGDSTAGTAGYGSTQLGADLGHVLNELDIHAVALMGHSMGGMATMAFAVDQPAVLRARVSSLILIATAASLVAPGSKLGFRLSGLTIPERLKPAQKRLRLGARLLAFGEQPSLNMIDTAIRSSGRLPEQVRAQATSALGAHDLLDRMGTIDLPTLVIGGSRDVLIRPSQVLDLANAIRGSELHMLEGAGHLIIWERHEMVDDIVLRFLSGLEHSPLPSQSSGPGN
jgi:pimeloyl-ACP methyl ester carboxylesterase